MSESTKPSQFQLGAAEIKQALSTQGISGVIDGFIDQRLPPRVDEEVPDTEKDPYAWIKARNSILGEPASQSILDFYRVFCNGIRCDGWQALDEQARRDIMTNVVVICQRYGAFNKDGAYYPGTTIASAYTIMEGMLFTKAVVAKTHGMDQAEKVTLQSVWSQPQLSEWMHSNVVNRVLAGQYTTPADEIIIPEPKKKES